MNFIIKRHEAKVRKGGDTCINSAVGELSTEKIFPEVLVSVVEMRLGGEKIRRPSVCGSSVSTIISRCGESTADV